MKRDRIFPNIDCFVGGPGGVDPTCTGREEFRGGGRLPSGEVKTDFSFPNIDGGLGL